MEESRQAELKELFKFTMLKSMFGVVWEGMGYVTMMVAFSALFTESTPMPSKSVVSVLSARYLARGCSENGFVRSRYA